MNFASPFAHVEALNALQELNAFFETSQDSNIRRTFYELDDITNLSSPTSGVSAIDNDDHEEDHDDEINQIRLQIENGRKLLESRILKYHEAKSALDQATRMHDMDQHKLKLIHSSFLTLENNKFSEALEAFETAKEQVEKQHADKIAELKKACDACTKDLQRMRSVYKILKTSDSTFACPICLKTQVECFMNPCGHTYCNACVQHAEDKCFICRKSYSRIHNLFFS
jgi:hypothetical protein